MPSAVWIRHGRKNFTQEAQVGTDERDQRSLGIAVVAPVADLTADHRPVLLLDEPAVVRPQRPASREVMPSPMQYGSRLSLMNWLPLSQVETKQGERQALADVESASKVHLRARLRRGYASVQPEATSVAQSEWANSPRVAALVADQVDLQNADLRVIPLGEGAHRDLALE